VRRPVIWYLREVVAIAAIAGCVWLGILWVVPA
jgi:hypothetical protein